jgi:hypothetical protein
MKFKFEELMVKVDEDVERTNCLGTCQASSSREEDPPPSAYEILLQQLQQVLQAAS